MGRRKFYAKVEIYAQNSKSRAPETRRECCGDAEKCVFLRTMNSDIIRLLPDSVANQIAAGEVIQRPASVVKELVENAVDAGADCITIILKDAGRTLIQVVDNGCGMSSTDARMAFERHATSKISAAADLFTLHTMGFRGEALPSIAAVAQIELRTMRRDDTVGTRLLISESKFEGQEPAPCVPGTNLAVKNIFFHMPARRKFLKKDSVELNHILREFERLALVNTNVDFTLIHNDITLHQFRRGSLKQRIVDLFGKGIEGQLAHIATETSLVKIEGFIGLPRSAKKRGYQQFLFVNGRNMRHPFFHKAVVGCYDQLISPDAQPNYFISFTVDPSTIDVNIHPQKHEIKFEHEQAIWQILVAAVKETLGKTQAAGALDFDTADAPEIPLFNPGGGDMPAEDFDSDFDPFKGDAGGTTEPRYGTRPMPVESCSRVRSRRDEVPSDWEALYDSFNRRRDDAYASVSLPDTDADSAPAVGDDAIFTPEAETPAAGFQIAERYIAIPQQGGLTLIAQHRAHVRILFDRFMAQLRGGEMPSQNLLFAEDFELSPAQSAMLQANMEHFGGLGFVIDECGRCRWSIRAVPAPLQGVSPVEAIVAVIDRLMEAGDDNADAFLAPVALVMARAGAVKPHQPLSQAEIEAIVADLYRCTETAYTPDGLQVVRYVSVDDIDRMFEI